jgi:hypothetical protein
VTRQPRHRLPDRAEPDESEAHPQNVAQPRVACAPCAFGDHPGERLEVLRQRQD